ncbi:MAG: hypothetical protein AB9856_09365 [Cellulosilyticaceae bacterium]
MTEKRLVVLFPGGNYSVDMPLLYYAEFIYEVRGYESLKVTYGNSSEKGKAFECWLEDVQHTVLEQLSQIDFSVYDDIVFVSKSIGTVIAGWIQHTMGIKVRNIYLTPLKETLPYMTKEDQIIIAIAGTTDKYIRSEKLKEHCEKESINLHLIEGVGHRLEMFGDMNKNIEILKEVVELY